MAHYELDSFVGKFKYLLNAGIKASLKLEAEDGKASVILSAGLGPFLPPLHGRHDGLRLQRGRGPAYRRRQERRKAAWDTAGKIPSETVEVCDSDAAAKAADEAKSLAEQAGIREASEEDGKSVEAKDDFRCPICDFVSNWGNGLQIHMSRKHAQIEQVDGNDSFDENEKYDDTANYLKTGYIGSNYQRFLDVNKMIDTSNLQIELKQNEKKKALEARKDAVGTEFKRYPPWNKMI